MVNGMERFSASDFPIRLTIRSSILDLYKPGGGFQNARGADLDYGPGWRTPLRSRRFISHLSPDKGRSKSLETVEPLVGAHPPSKTTISAGTSGPNHLSIVLSNPTTTVSRNTVVLPTCVFPPTDPTTVTDVTTIMNLGLLSSNFAAAPLLAKSISTTIPRLLFSAAVANFVVYLRDIISPQMGPSYVFPWPFTATCLVSWVAMLLPWITFCIDIGVAAQHITLDLRGRFNVPGIFFDVLCSFLASFRSLYTLDIIFEDIIRVWNHRKWLSDFWNKFRWRIREAFCHPGIACTCCSQKPQIRVVFRERGPSNRIVVWILPGPFLKAFSFWHIPLLENGKGFYYSNNN